jgi:hypothetical protein
MTAWKSLFASVVGSSHVEHQQNCQDACRVTVNQDYWMGVVCDGAGSAAFGGEGAQFVVEYLPPLITAIAPLQMNLQHLSDCIDQARQALCEFAEQSGQRPRDYACTLLVAVIADQQAWFAQIGDGAMVIANGFTQGVIFWPEQGVYANMTHFLTDDNALEHVHLSQMDVGVMEIAMFSDGLQRLALNFTEQTSHPGFFNPMWQQLRRSQNVSLLNQQLEDFLQSDSVNSRTDDDKALVLATRLLADDI